MHFVFEIRVEVFSFVGARETLTWFFTCHFLSSFLKPAVSPPALLDSSARANRAKCLIRNLPTLNYEDEPFARCLVTQLCRPFEAIFARPELVP